MTKWTLEELEAIRLADKEINREAQRNGAAQKKTYRPEYYRANKDRIAAQRAAYYRTHKEEHAARCAAYYASHREEISAYKAEYYKAHRDEINSRSIAYYWAHREEIRDKRRRPSKDTDKQIQLAAVDSRESILHTPVKDGNMDE